ncbi:DUF4019 domain-containing protein [Vibrio jasicida]|uniref:DUF4019 domain-containing protein n=1 Tax=Vibrio jasicida TaxID=766224 RepID=A0AAU9QK48_9VIBR|nr:DUF4019 domain-containing protein [Vibrio jasicida]CAH1573208.1 exported hypothetical protein [Vibrio jasicida]CAH1588585.1 exported hypothetical protein [Vibrio jasicida]
MFRKLLILMMLWPFSVLASSGSSTQSALDWLKLVDDSQYQQSWIESSSLFQEQVSEQTWLGAMNSIRAPLAKVNSRKKISEEEMQSPPNVPAGEYVVFQFKTSFANKDDAIETVTVVKQDMQWRVVGYFIK